MNNVLKLSGKKYNQKERRNSTVSLRLPKTSKITLKHLEELHRTLLYVKNFWKEKDEINGALISVYYKEIIAKSNRIQEYLRKNSASSTVDSIVGAKFNDSKTAHIITHFVSFETLQKTIEKSQNAINLFRASFSNGIITGEEYNKPSTFKKLPYDSFGMGKTKFKQLLHDAFFIEKFGIEKNSSHESQSAIVTFYNIQKDIKTILSKVGVHVTDDKIIEDYTVLLDEHSVNTVMDKLPHLVSMAVTDFTKLTNNYTDVLNDNFDEIKLGPPNNEPVIGVIDTLFDTTHAYFSEWVEYYDMLSPDIFKEPADYNHGTAVTSLIVDAPSLNPKLDDECGNFRVRHFGVSPASGFHSFTLIKQIRRIVSENTDIHVWNLSLGSINEIPHDFISIEGAALDNIQNEFNVIFVIAGTNAQIINGQRKRIGAPADSLNSVIVNAVDFEKNPTDYTRKGIVLSFFTKPDVAYYGGSDSKREYITVWQPSGKTLVTGTSYAAPLIARKLAYLIDIMNLKREEAKALLIDSAIPWNNHKSYEEQILVGNGVVPTKISDILSSANDEIKFIVSDTSFKYDTYNYDFPVPISQGKFPYVAKATMCYFPKCSRNQGVDYTNTELNLKFGRLSATGDPIKTINNDKQNVDIGAPGYIRETTARSIFRKWDNVKHISEKFTPQKRPKNITNTSNPSWGMSVKTIERLKKRTDDEGIDFGVVVTLKELHGVNRIDEFISKAQLKGWIVTQLQNQYQLDLFNLLSEEIEFE